ncbi:hypothetical protein ABT187_45305 [Streptomyces sp. NPDC001817]|uniref:hypothetical protein n=1 Tax=Streptomyces sp. NPDC001817 TaxID=3154398 RepID=UPI003319A31D
MAPDCLGDAGADPLDVEAQPDALGSFAVGREVVFQCVVDTWARSWRVAVSWS